MNKQSGNIIIWALVIGLLFFFFGGNDSEDYGDSGYKPSTYNDPGYSDYDEGSYYENYPVGFEGSDYMEACNGNTGSCYDLEIDSDGENVERINFPNGGWRDVNYSDCEEGYCVVEDEDGTEWELQY